MEPIHQKQGEAVEGTRSTVCLISAQHRRRTRELACFTDLNLVLSTCMPPNTPPHRWNKSGSMRPQVSLSTYKVEAGTLRSGASTTRIPVVQANLWALWDLQPKTPPPWYFGASGVPRQPPRPGASRATSAEEFPGTVETRTTRLGRPPRRQLRVAAPVDPGSCVHVANQLGDVCGFDRIEESAALVDIDQGFDFRFAAVVVIARLTHLQGERVGEVALEYKTTFQSWSYFRDGRVSGIAKANGETGTNIVRTTARYVTQGAG